MELTEKDKMILAVIEAIDDIVDQHGKDYGIVQVRVDRLRRWAQKLDAALDQ